MSIKLIQERLNSYNCRSALEEEHAIREITQEVALAALSRTNFFKHGILQGGTCLRIFYGLNRFSEDFDFILKNPNPDFKLQPHLQSLSEEIEAYGYKLILPIVPKPILQSGRLLSRMILSGRFCSSIILAKKDRFVKSGSN